MFKRQTLTFDFST